MTITTEREAQIRRLYFVEHWPVGTISSQLLQHEDVVKRVLGLLEPPQRVLIPRVCLLDPYADFITEVLTAYPRLRATRLYDMLKARGYTGSTRTVRKHVATVRPRPQREAFLQLEPLPGEQSQIDWAYVCKTTVPSGQRPLWLFVIVLSYSRAMWAEFVYDIGAHGLCRSLVRAASYFKGTTRRWLFDNAKAVVLERYGDSARFHPNLVTLSGHYHTQLRLCQVRKANQKGKVERAIRYLRERFLAGRKIHNIAQGNRELHQFLDEIANKRPHPTKHASSVADCLAEESQTLLALPDTPANTDVILPVVIDRYANARFDTNRYSVPPSHVGCTLTLVADDNMVRILDGDSEVSRHQRCWGKKQLCENVEHRREILVHKPQGFAGGAGRQRLLAVAPEISTLLKRWVQEGRNIGNLTARTLKLLDLYGNEIFILAVSEAAQRHSGDLGALALLCAQLHRKRQRPLPLEIQLGDHILDRDVMPHDLGSYDGN